MRELEISKEKIRLTGLEPNHVTIALVMIFTAVALAIVLTYCHVSTRPPTGQSEPLQSVVQTSNAPMAEGLPAHTNLPPTAHPSE